VRFGGLLRPLCRRHAGCSRVLRLCLRLRGFAAHMCFGRVFAVAGVLFGWCRCRPLFFTFVVRASAGFRPGGRVTFLCGQESNQRKSPHIVAALRAVPCARVLCPRSLRVRPPRGGALPPWGGPATATQRKPAWLRNSPFLFAMKPRTNGAQTVLAIPLRGHAAFLALLGDAEGEFRHQPLHLRRRLG